MAIDANILREYLVKLGFDIQNSEFDKFKRFLDDVTKKVADNTEGMTKAYVKAAGTIVGAIATVTGAIVTMMDKVAQADLEYRKFGMRMFMTADVAKKFKIALDTMGESLNDIAWNPELRSRFQQLYKEGGMMGLPGDMEKQFLGLRNLRFEFSRFRQELTFGLEWITYHLTKMRGGELSSFQGLLHRANDWIIRQMPIWSQKIATVLNLFLQVWHDLASAFHAAKWALQPFVDLIVTLYKHLSDNGKLSAWITVVTVAFAASGPFGRAMIVLSAVIALIMDFNAYMEGRRSAGKLAPIWQTFIDTVNLASKGLLTLMIIADRAYQVLHLTGKALSTWSWKEAKADFAEISRIRSGTEAAVADAMKSFEGITPRKPETLRATGEPAPAGYTPESTGRPRPAGVAPQPAPGSGLAGIAYAETRGEKDPYTAQAHKWAPESHAYGKYQIQPDTWEGALKQMHLPRHTPQTPENQEIVARFLYSSYMNRFQNDQLAALAWRLGPGYAQRAMGGDTSFITPKINEYIKTATGSYFGQQAKGGSTKTVSVGTVQVNVTNPNASAEEIATHTVKKINEMEERENARQVQFAVYPVS